MLDDLPLRGVGVLRLVDEDVVDLPIELVANPFADSGLPEELPGPFDEVVEVGDAGGTLCPRVGSGKGLACTQPGSHVRGKSGAILDTDEVPDEDRKAACRRFIVWLGFRLARRHF